MKRGKVYRENRELFSGALGQDEEIEEETVLAWANGHFFDDVLALTGTQTSSKSDEEARQLAEDIERYHFLQAYSWRSPK